MFTSEYFRSELQREAEGLRRDHVVEVYLANGHAHRLRAVVTVPQGHVVLDVYRQMGDAGQQQPSWRDDANPHGAAQPTRRIAVGYESIVEVRIDAEPASSPAPLVPPPELPA